MNSATLKELRLQSTYPRGIAARVDSADLKRLLDERETLLEVVEMVRDADDDCRKDGMRRTLTSYARQVLVGALVKAGAP